MNSPYLVDFKASAAKLQANEVGSTDIVIRSGQCAEDAALDLLRAWRKVTELPFGLWEELSAVRIDRDGLPATAWPLLRARLFGPGGDLDLWRIDAVFGWRFVGPAATALPAEESQQGLDFWTQPDNAGARFYRSEVTYLLWGKNQRNGIWREDRVAASMLRYPVAEADKDSERVQVRSVLYSRRGLVEFVWHQGLEGYHG